MLSDTLNNFIIKLESLDNSKYSYIIPCNNEIREQLIKMWWEVYNGFWDLRILNDK